MLKFLATLFFLAFIAPQAFASPTFLYGFSITSFSCDNHPYIFCPDGAASDSASSWSGPLGKLKVGLHVDAIFDQSASLLINGLGESGSITNQGFNSFDPARWNTHRGALHLGKDALTGPPDIDYWLDTTFHVSRYLTGSLYINNSRDEVFMSTSGSNLWSGFIRSDELGESSSVLDFTGEWKFIRVIPEPSIVLLFIGAALAATAMRTKQAL